MFADRLIVNTDAQGNFDKLPELPPNSGIELIFLVLEESQPPMRQPAPSIAGKGKIVGDILSPVIPAEDWDVLR